MAELILPESIRDVEQVQSVRTPFSLEYTVTASGATQVYLEGFATKKIMGQCCPVDGAVFVPPKAVCPVHGIETPDFVEVPAVGHVGSFCVTRVPIPGRDDLEIPYVSGWIFLDGASVGFLGLVSGCEFSDVRLGMRVRAKWKPDAELASTPDNILWWEPTGEPDVPGDKVGHGGWTGQGPGLTGNNAGGGTDA